MCEREEIFRLGHIGLYAQKGKVAKQNLASFFPMPQGAVALMFNNTTSARGWTIDERLCHDNMLLAFVSIHHCTECGVPVMRHEEMYEGLCCYCPKCEAAPL